MRDRWGVPGMTTDVALGFRDKELMKKRVARRAGLECPPRRSGAARSASVREAAGAGSAIH